MRNSLASDSLFSARLFLLIPLLYTPAAEPVAPTLRTQTAPSFDFASALPSSTAVYLSFPDLARSQKNSGNLAWTKLAREEEVKAFVEKPVAYAKEKGFPAMWKKIQKETGEDLSFLENVKIHSFDLALTGFKLPAKDEESATLDMLVSIGLGNDAAKVESLIRAASKKPEAEAKIEEVNVDGVTLVVATPNEGVLDDDAPFNCVAWFVHQGRLVFSFNRGPAEMALKALLGKEAGPTLLQDKEYQLSMSKVAGGNADFRAFVRIGETYRKVANGIRAKFSAPKDDDGPKFLIMEGMFSSILNAIDKLGIGDLGSLGMGWSTQDSVSLDQTFLSAAPGARKGLCRLLSSKPIDKGLLAKVPKEAQSFNIFSMNVASLWDTLWEAGEAADPEKSKAAKEGLAAFETQLGVKLKEDLVDSLGESFIIYSMPMQSIMGGTPELYLLIEAKDREKLEKSAMALIKFAAEQSGEFQLKENVFEGGKSFSISIPELKKNPMLASVAPTIAFADKFLIVGMSKAGVKKTVKRLSSPDAGEGAAAIPDFAKFAANFPKEVTGLSYSDPRPTMTALYQAVQMFAPMATAQFPGEFPIDFAMLPSSATIGKHFFGSAGYSTASENGWHSVSYASSGADAIFCFASIAKTLTGVGFGVASDMESRRHGGDSEDMGGEDDEEEGDPGMPPPPEIPKPPKAPPTPIEIAKQDLLDLKSGITIFKIETGKYPNALEDLLKTSTELPEGCLPGKKAVPLDPWGRSYLFVLDAANKTYKLRSKGPNGVDDAGKGDDVVGN